MAHRTASVGLNLARTAITSRNGLIANRALLRSLVVKRNIQTDSLPPSAAQDILNTQRLKRPSSPHFTIYQPQLTWVGSIFNRVTGAALSTLLYGFSLAYIMGPVFGLPFDGAAVVSLVQQLPEWVKISAKALLAAPFTFHSFNGLRHLAWDSGKFLTVKGAYSSGYAVIGASAIATLVLVFM